MKQAPLDPVMRSAEGYRVRHIAVLVGEGPDLRWFRVGWERVVRIAVHDTGVAVYQEQETGHDPLIRFYPFHAVQEITSIEARS